MYSSVALYVCMQFECTLCFTRWQKNWQTYILHELHDCNSLTRGRHKWDLLHLCRFFVLAKITHGSSTVCTKFL